MRLTTKGRYAVTAMLDVALNAGESPVNLSDISRRQGISLSYLEQLFARLKKKKLVESVRGPGGGYRLNTEKKTLSVLEIIDAVDENIEVTRCQRQGNCQEGEECLTHHLWLDLSEQIRAFLAQATLDDLIERRDILSTSARQNQAQADIPLLKLQSDSN